MSAGFVNLPEDSVFSADVVPASDSLYNIGSPDLQWADGYFSGTVHTHDVQLLGGNLSVNQGGIFFGGAGDTDGGIGGKIGLGFFDPKFLFLSGYQDNLEIATPANPAAGRVRLYIKADGKLYRLNSAGTETLIG